MVMRIMVERLFWSAMHLSVALRVAVQPFECHTNLAGYRLLVDAAWDATAPERGDFSGQH